jgi:hypothetical protein
VSWDAKQTSEYGLDKTHKLERLWVGVCFLYEPIIYKRQDELKSNLTKLIKHKERVKQVAKL